MSTVASKKENELIQYHHGRVMRYMIRNQAPGMDKLSEITKHIYISNWKNGCDLHLLREHGIKGVLCVTNQQKPEAVLRNYEKRGISHKQIPFAPPVEGEPPDNMLVHARDMNNFILSHIEKEDRVLVHCQDGVSLSPAAVAIFALTRHYMINYIDNMSMTKKLVKPDHMFAPTIIRMLKEYRPCILIHPAFAWQVLVAEMILKRQFAAEFRKYLAQERHTARKEKNKQSNDSDISDTSDTLKVVPKSKGPVNGSVKEDTISDEDISAYISQAIDNHSEFDELSDLKGIRKVREESRDVHENHHEVHENHHEHPVNNDIIDDLDNFDVIDDLE